MADAILNEAHKIVSTELAPLMDRNHKHGICTWHLDMWLVSNNDLNGGNTMSTVTFRF